MKTCQEILQLSTNVLAKYKVNRPRFIAESLLAHHLGMKRLELYMYFDRPITEEELSPFRALLKRAMEKEPIEYIIGEVEFYQTKIKVTPDVLIPRPETEILLDIVCKQLVGNEKKALDLCTGSGCLAIGLKRYAPSLEVFGVDISERALRVAVQNSSDVHWLLGDLTHPVQGHLFDLVLCNPPYISEKEYEGLDISVKGFEPKLALVGGKTGYEFYERLSHELPAVLRPKAKVFFEIGCNQAETVQKIFSSTDGKSVWEDLKIERDWAGHPRSFSLKLKEISHIMQEI